MKCKITMQKLICVSNQPPKTDVMKMSNPSVTNCKIFSHFILHLIRRRVCTFAVSHFINRRHGLCLVSTLPLPFCRSVVPLP